jgi:aspartate dehydrogenase
MRIKMRKLKVGIIGCGTIGSEIAMACCGTLKEKFSLIAICDVDHEKAAGLRNRLSKGVLILNLDALIGKADLVVEAASAKISAEILEKCIKRGKDVLIMSVGGLIGREAFLKSALKSRVYIPSGAICGIDGLKSASSGRIDSVTLTTRKPPKALEGAPYIKEKGIDLVGMTAETVIFEGSAEDAIKGFPQNVNVSAVLSLAGIGAAKTRVRIVVTPGSSKNVHEIEITGDFGRISTRTENVPSKTNPKTSALAMLSAISTLGAIAEGVRIGT